MAKKIECMIGYSDELVKQVNKNMKLLDDENTIDILNEKLSNPSIAEVYGVTILLGFGASIEDITRRSDSFESDEEMIRELDKIVNRLFVNNDDLSYFKNQPIPING